MLVLLSYALPTLLLFAPVLPQFTTAIVTGPAGYQDSWQNVWTLWWAQRALSHGQNPLYTTMLYYPTGVGLFWQTLGITNGILAFPLTTAVNAIASFNTIAPLTFILSGYTMYLLAYRVVGSPGGAWLAGLLFAFVPYHVAKLVEGQLDLLSLQYLPLFALCLIKGLDQGEWKHVLFGGLLLAWITFTCLYYGFFSLIYLGLYIALLGLRRRSWADLRRLAARGVAIVLPLIALLAPLLAGGSGGDPPNWQQRQILHSATPLDFVLPGPYGPLWGPWVTTLQARLHPEMQAGATITAGVVALLLGAAGLVLARRQAWPWAVIAACLMLLALGPVLVINGRTTAIALPFALLDYLPGARSGQRPNHIVAYSNMLLALLAAFGWVQIQQRLPGAWRRLALAAALAVVAIDLWPIGLFVSPLATPSFYATIPPASHGAVLELPFQPDTSDDLRAQLVHQRPIIGGYLARIPDYPFANDTDGIRQLWLNNPALQSIAYPDWTQALTPTLQTYDVEYVVLHLAGRSQNQYRSLRKILDAKLDRVFEDPTMVAYRRPADAPQSLILSLSSTDWYAIEQRGQQRWQWIGPSAALTLASPFPDDSLTELRFTVGAFDRARDVVVEQQIGRQWRRLAVLTVAPLPAQRQYRLLLPAPPRISRIRLTTSSDRSDELLPRDLSIVFTDLSIRVVGQAAHQ